MNFAPVVLFVYDRPEHVQRTIEALQQNLLAIDSELIIYSDAPKTLGQTKAVNDVRQFLHNISGFKTIRIVERKENLGLARSVIDGVTEVVNEYGNIIVLEDDLITSPGFLSYMNDALEHFSNDAKIMQISGYMFPVEIESETDAIFLPLTTSWGWATWKRAWDIFDVHAIGYARLKADRLLRKQFNLDGAYDYFSMLEGQVQGHVDSWAVRWQLSVFLEGGLTLYPLHSLVINTGFDGSGTHGVMRGLLSKSGMRDGFVPMRFPDKIRICDSWEQVRESLRKRMSLPERALLNLRRQLRKLLEAIKLDL